jgi:DNA-binding winged helix-turn-helix (wHTH) protein/TolB-like protein
MVERAVRFGVFEFTFATRQLRRDGRVVKLQAQPARLLAALLAHAGEIVSRERLQQEVWAGGTHVDFERGLNFCMAQVRSALGDSADAPRYIETIPKQGYRFIAPVADVPLLASTTPQAADDGGTPRARLRPSVPTGRFGWIVATLVAIVVFGALARLVSGRGTATAPAVIVVPFYNETGRPELASVAAALGDATVARLAGTRDRLATLSVIGNAASLRRPFAREDVQGIARQLGADWVVIGQLKGDDRGLRVIGHLIRASDMKHVWASSFDHATFTLDVQAQVAESIAAAVSHAVSTH